MSDINEQQFNELIASLKTTAGTLGRIADNQSGSSGRARARSRLSNDMQEKERFRRTKKMNDALGMASTQLFEFTTSTDSAIRLVSDVAKKFIGGAVIGLLIHSAKEYTETYKQLTDVGQNFQGSMLKMGIAAAEAGMPLDDFAKEVQRNSKVIAALDSQKSFFKLAYDVRKTSERFGMFGMTTDQINENLGDYMESMRLYGNIEAHNNRRTVDNFIQLTETTTALSGAFGTSRREIMKAVTDALSDTLVATRLLQTSGEAQQDYALAIGKATAFMAAQPGIAGDVFSKMVSQSFGAGTALFADEAKTFINAGFGQAVGMFDTIREKIEKGTFTDTDALNFFHEFKEQGEAAAESLRLQALSGNEDAKKVLQIITQMRDITEKEFREKQEAARAQEGLTQFMNNINNIFNRLVGVFKLGMLGSLERLTDKLSAFADGPGLDGLIKNVENAGKSFGHFLEVALNKENIDTVYNTISTLGSWLFKLGEIVASVVGGINSIYKSIMGVFSDNETTINGFAGALTAATTALLFMGGKAGIKRFWDRLTKKVDITAATVNVRGNYVNDGGQDNFDFGGDGDGSDRDRNRRRRRSRGRGGRGGFLRRMLGRGRSGISRIMGGSASIFNSMGGGSAFSKIKSLGSMLANNELMSSLSGVVSNGLKSTASFGKRALGFSKSLASGAMKKLLGPVAAVLMVGETGEKLTELYQQRANGEISEEQFKQSVSQIVGSFVGGAGGAIALGQAGALAGGAVGSIIPGAGTAIGGAAGFIGGAAIGGIGMSYGSDFGEYIGNMIYEKMLSDNAATPTNKTIGANVRDIETDIAKERNQTATTNTMTDQFTNLTNAVNEQTAIMIAQNKEHQKLIKQGIRNGSYAMNGLN